VQLAKSSLAGVCTSQWCALSANAALQLSSHSGPDVAESVWTVEYKQTIYCWPTPCTTQVLGTECHLSYAAGGKAAIRVPPENVGGLLERQGGGQGADPERQGRGEQANPEMGTNGHKFVHRRNETKISERLPPCFMRCCGVGWIERARVSARKCHADHDLLPKA